MIRSLCYSKRDTFLKTPTKFTAEALKITISRTFRRFSVIRIALLDVIIEVLDVENAITARLLVCLVQAVKIDLL